MKHLLFFLLAFPFFVSAQILEKQFVATVQYNGFTQINDSLYRGDLIEFRDVLIEGYQPSGVDSGFICLDGTGRAYRVEVVNSFDYSSLNVDLIELDDYDEIPIGVGIVAERYGSTYQIPNGLVNSIGISSVLQAKILNHNTKIAATTVQPPDTLYIQELSGTTAISDGDTIPLIDYVRVVDTPAMLLNYPSTAGYGIIDGGKTWRADTTSPNGLATRLFVKNLPTYILADRLVRSNGTNLVVGNLSDNGTRLAALLPWQFQTYTTAGLPTGVTGYHVYNTTTNGPGWYQGSRWAYGLESTANVFTTGSVIFANANGQANQDNANLFWDDTNNRLGVGTNAPVGTMDINGNVYIPFDVSFIRRSGSGSHRMNMVTGGTGSFRLTQLGLNQPGTFAFLDNSSNETILFATIRSGYHDFEFRPYNTAALSFSQNRVRMGSRATPVTLFSLNEVIDNSSGIPSTVVFTAGRANTGATGVNQNGGGGDLVIQGGLGVGTGGYGKIYATLSEGTTTTNNLQSTDTLLALLREGLGIKTKIPVRTLHVTGEVRITDLTTDTPTRIVGADGDGDLGDITLGANLSLIGNVLSATGGSADGNGIYSNSGTLANHTTRARVPDNGNLFFSQTFNSGADSAYFYINNYLSGERAIGFGLTDTASTGFSRGFFYSDGAGEMNWELETAGASGTTSVKAQDGTFSVTTSGGNMSLNAGVANEVAVVGLVKAKQEAYNEITSTTSPVTLSNTYSDNLINQGGTQATFTFKLPASPTDGQISKATFANAVTVLTIDGNGTTVVGTLPTTVNMGTQIIFKNYTGVGWVRQL